MATPALGFGGTRAVALVLVCGVLGVGIDADHFLVARIRTGSWAAVGRVVRDPRLPFTDQDAIFESDAVGRLPRLLSHVLIAGPLVAGIGLVDTRLALLAAVVLYFHLLCDLLADVRATTW
jgi:hypothetical protein